MLDIRPAGPEDLGAIRVLLAVCLLPSQDVKDESIVFFVAESERGIIGVCGIEQCDDATALLRTLGVMPGYRKQQIGRRLLQRAISHAEDTGVDEMYLVTETAGDYFSSNGFTTHDKKATPDALKASRQLTQRSPASALLMTRSMRTVATDIKTAGKSQISNRAKRHFDDGYHCAESVLLAAAEHAGISSPLIPGIATGFCHGTARTWGTCGALSGAIMAVNLTHGRNSPAQCPSGNYQAVQSLIEGFAKTCGSTLCSELMGCDLDTRDGLKTYQDDRLRDHCRGFVGVAARLAAQIIDEKRDWPFNTGSSDAAA